MKLRKFEICAILNIGKSEYMASFFCDRKKC